MEMIRKDKKKKTSETVGGIGVRTLKTILISINVPYIQTNTEIVNDTEKLSIKKEINIDLFHNHSMMWEIKDQYLGQTK